MRIIVLFNLILLSTFASAQTSVTITGKVQNQYGVALEGVDIQVVNSSKSVKSKKDGSYNLYIVSSSPKLKISFSRAGFIPQIISIDTSLRTIKKDVFLVSEITQLDTVTVNSSKNEFGNLHSIDAGLIRNIPSVSGNFESLLKTLPGVSSNNELSSQYSVRGGNFDENLIYINDIEIYRPLLVRNGQQEGLSFINPELVSKANFSAGGFEAKYGDKLSSVLDVRYNKPDSAQIIASAGLLGLSATLKQPLKNGFLLTGIRKKTNQSILRSQPVVGSYQPSFYDFQGLYSLNLNKKLNLSVFGDYNISRFSLIPESRETVFGTIDQQYRLKIHYQGQEKDRYESLAGAITLTYKPRQNAWFKWITTSFSNSEQETFDIEGSYIFDETGTDTEFENVNTNRGIGVSYDYARNRLKTSIYSSEIRAYLQKQRSFWESGIRYQYDLIHDNLNEYHLIDSAGYTLPKADGDLILTDVVSAGNSIKTNRFTAFVQNTFPLSSQVTVSAGLRSNYSSYTNDLLLSPRISAVYHPSDGNRIWRFSTGLYNQPPFYRELRNFNGSLNKESTTQRSIHFLAATDYLIQKRGETFFKFTSEVYFKKLNNLVPYKIENLRIRYFADQRSHGYVTGADFSVSKEFVPGLESSFRLSLMKTAEDIDGDSYQVKDENGTISTVYPGYLKRPTDQRINFSAFFQDELFNSPTYKVHLTLLYGSALPVGPPQTQRYRDEFKIPSYRRVDIGFSKDFLEGGTKYKLKPLNRYLNSLIAYAEVFNLLNIYNTVSFLWIKDVNNNQFAIPNYLTSRQLNIKFIAKIKN